MRDAWRQRRESARVRACPRIMVVAHPDDEVLWGGATLARGDDWGVVCLTNRRTAWRHDSFHRAMRVLGCPGVVLDVPDRGFEPPTPEDTEQIRRIVTSFVRPGFTRQVMTHSPDGETGHKFHRAISVAVSSVVARDLLHYFNFSPESDLRTDDPTAWSMKRAALEQYFESLDTAPGNDALHVKLSVHEAPCPAQDYARPNALLLSYYRGSTVPAGSIEKGILE